LSKVRRDRERGAVQLIEEEPVPGKAGLSSTWSGTLFMANSLFPTSELGRLVPKGVPASRGIELWAEWSDTCEEFLFAGLRRQVGPGGDVRAAYRQWYAEQMTGHDRTMLHLLEEFDRRSPSRGY
jgi:hypothetical protein